MRKMNRRDFGKVVAASALPLMVRDGMARAITSEPTVREQLAGQVAAIQATWEQSPPTRPGFASKGFRLESPPVALPMALIRRFLCGVNSAEICGAPAGHLAIFTFRWDRSRYLPPWEIIQLPKSEDFPLVGAELAYCSIPWDERAWRLGVALFMGHPPCDFDELLAAWDVGMNGSPSS